MTPVGQVADFGTWPQLVEGNDSMAGDVSVLLRGHDDDQAWVQWDGEVAQVCALIHHTHHEVDSFLFQCWRQRHSS